MVYRKCNWVRDIFILCTYVAPAHRRNGHYRRMYNHLREAAAKQLPGWSISSGVMHGNKAMHKTMEAMGRQPMATYYREYLP